MKERMARHTKDQLKKIKGKTDHIYVGNTSDTQIKKQVERDSDSYLPTDDELKRFKRIDEVNFDD